MGRVNMERKFVEGNIPVWDWNGIFLVRIGTDKFVTLQPVPVKEEIRTLTQAKVIAKEFSQKHNCQATVTYENEWINLVDFLKTNYATKEFLKMNNLTQVEPLLLDSISEGESHVLAAGPSHCLNEIFCGFISGDDADGEPQTKKVLFLTIREMQIK